LPVFRFLRAASCSEGTIPFRRSKGSLYVRRSEPFFSISLAPDVESLAAAVFGAQMPQKAVIVSYPDNTPDSILDQAKAAIKAAGGMVTHEYKLIKGFAAKAPAKVLENVQMWGNDYHAVIEEDQMVSIAESGD